ncbi:MAG: FG-GAP-like repeat-containing protein, partial [Acidobacteriota bacterium]
AVTTESLAAGELGVAYSGALAGSGGRPFYYWSIDSGALPDGLAMNSRGEISGVPAMTGAFTFVVRLTDSTSPQQAATRELSITIGEYTGLGHTISGRVTFGGLPLAGVTMTGLPGTPTTTSAGSYVAVVADGWSGTVTPALTGHAFTPATRAYDNVTASAAGQDFAAYVTRTISGAVTLNSAGLAGVLMSGLPGDPVTGGGGSYSAVVPDGWSGTVTPALAGYAFTPANRAYEAVAADMTAQDYAAAAAAVAKEDFLATWDGQGVYYKNSDTGGWVKLASPATMIAAGDLDGDGIDDIIGLWPGQGGIWVKYSQSGSWAKLSSTAVHIAAGDMNGDGREDLLGTWDGQGVFYRNSIGGAWVKLASPATLITTGDLDGDGTDDLAGIWPSQGGVWVKYSHTGAWAKLSSTARDICVGDADGDGRDDLIATWDGQGVFYRNSISGAWVKMASVATQVACGDLDGDGKADLIGIWPTQGGVWVKYSKTGAWALLSSTAVDISAGKMRSQGTSQASVASEELTAPSGGQAEGPGTAAKVLDLSDNGPGGRYFRPEGRENLVPGKGPSLGHGPKKPGPGEKGFKWTSQANLSPGSGNDINPRKEPKKVDKSLKNKG